MGTKSVHRIRRGSPSSGTERTDRSKDPHGEVARQGTCRSLVSGIRLRGNQTKDPRAAEKRRSPNGIVRQGGTILRERVGKILLAELQQPAGGDEVPRGGQRPPRAANAARRTQV